MEASSFAALAGLSMGALLAMTIVGVLLAALLLALSFRLVLGYLPSYLRALGAVLLTALAVLAVSAGLRLVLPAGVGQLLPLLLQFLIGAAVVDRQLLDRTGDRIGLPRAGLVELIYLVLGLLLLLLLGVVLGLLPGVH